MASISVSQLCFIIKGIVAPSGAITTLDINLVNGSRNTNSNATTKSGGTIGNGDGAMASTSMWGPLPAFNLILEFFHKLQWNYQGVKIEKLRSLQDFQCKPHESLRKTYAWMPKLIMVTQGVIEAQTIQFWYRILDKKLRHWVQDVILIQHVSPTLAIVFQLSERIKMNMVEEWVVTLRFNKENPRFPTPSNQ